MNKNRIEIRYEEGYRCEVFFNGKIVAASKTKKTKQAVKHWIGNATWNDLTIYDLTGQIAKTITLK